MPEGSDLNAHHFAVLDKGARDNNEPTMVVCRIGGIGHKDNKLYLFRKPPTLAIEHLIGAPSDAWIEMSGDGKRNAEIEYDDGNA